jgi:hypothetical protein
MTLAQELTQLADVVMASYEQQQRQFAKLVAQENKLRAELNRLDDMRRATHVPEARVAKMQAIGADVIWLGWVGRSKTTLNIQLAQILAQKENHQSAVRKAYGKVLVVQQMRDDALQEAATNLAKRQLANAVNQSLARQ